jgi:hypothetical protein
MKQIIIEIDHWERFQFYIGLNRHLVGLSASTVPSNFVSHLTGLPIPIHGSAPLLLYNICLIGRQVVHLNQPTQIYGLRHYAGDGNTKGIYLARLGKVSLRRARWQGLPPLMS